MTSVVDNAIAIIGSVLLHALILYLLLAGFRWEAEPPPPIRTTLKATVVSDEAFRLAEDEIEQRAAEPPPVDTRAQEQAALERQRVEAEQVAEAAARQREVERERQAEEAQRQREAAQAAARQRQTEADAERERQAAETAARERREAQQAELKRREAEEAERKRLEAEQAVRQKREAEEAERKRLEAEQAARQKREAEEAERKRREAEEAERKKREAEEERRRKAEAQRQQALEAQLRDAMEAEEARTGAIDAGLLAQYVEVIRQKVERNWIRPQGVPDGIRCEVLVRQLRNGEVVSVRVADCAGGEILIRSIETAVRKASPLPLPQDPSLFEPNLRFPFKTGD